MVIKAFRSVKCIGCGKEVPCLNRRMLRCQECIDVHIKQVRRKLIETNEREIGRI